MYSKIQSEIDYLEDELDLAPTGSPRAEFLLERIRSLEEYGEDCVFDEDCD